MTFISNLEWTICLITKKELLIYHIPLQDHTSPPASNIRSPGFKMSTSSSELSAHGDEGSGTASVSHSQSDNTEQTWDQVVDNHIKKSLGKVQHPDTQQTSQFTSLRKSLPMLSHLSTVLCPFCSCIYLYYMFLC